MAKPKITRLGDPSNPYTKKTVTAEQARKSAKDLGVKIPQYKADKKAAPAKKKEPRTGALGRARKAALDKKIKDSGG